MALCRVTWGTSSDSCTASRSREGSDRTEVARSQSRDRLGSAGAEERIFQAKAHTGHRSSQCRRWCKHSGYQDKAATWDRGSRRRICRSRRPWRRDIYSDIRRWDRVQQRRRQQWQPARRVRRWFSSRGSKMMRMEGGGRLNGAKGKARAKTFRSHNNKRSPAHFKLAQLPHNCPLDFICVAFLHNLYIMPSSHLKQSHTLHRRAAGSRRSGVFGNDSSFCDMVGSLWRLSPKDKT